jgi:hypothetical protein
MYLAHLCSCWPWRRKKVDVGKVAKLIAKIDAESFMIADLAPHAAAIKQVKAVNSLALLTIVPFQPHRS